MKVQEYHFEKATVRIHGDPPKQEVLEKACIQFAMAIERAKLTKKESSLSDEPLDDDERG